MKVHEVRIEVIKPHPWHNSDIVCYVALEFIQRVTAPQINDIGVCPCLEFNIGFAFQEKPTIISLALSGVPGDDGYVVSPTSNPEAYADQTQSMYDAHRKLLSAWRLTQLHLSINKE